MAIQKVEIHGLRRLHSALKKYEADLKGELEDRLRDAGRIVSDNAKQRFSTIDARSASGFRPRLRGFGRVQVEQSRRRTTGQHPEFGSLQMRTALLPARAEAMPKVLSAMENMLDDLSRRFDR